MIAKNRGNRPVDAVLISGKGCIGQLAIQILFCYQPQIGVIVIPAKCGLGNLCKALAGLQLVIGGIGFCFFAKNHLPDLSALGRDKFIAAQIKGLCNLIFWQAYLIHHLFGADQDYLETA